MKLVLFATLFASASAFAPIATPAARATSLNAAQLSDPDFCQGLPGALPPVGNFDPLGFLEGADENQVTIL